MTNEQEQTKPKWVEEAEEALNRATNALRTAWEETKDERVATLEAAKEAASRLGQAIDHGIEVAKERLGPTAEETDPEESAAPAEPATEEE